MWKKQTSIASALLFTAVIVLGNLIPLGISEKAEAFVACTPVSASNIKAHWKFDEGAGTSTADATGNGHTGSLINGPQWVTDTAPLSGPNPFALQFDGTDDHVLSANSNDLRFGTGTFTVTLFARTGSGDRSVLGNFNGVNRGWGLYLYSSNNLNFFGYGDLGINDTAKPGIVLNDQWHHIAGVYTRSGSSLTIATYLDGVLVGSNTTTVGDISSLTDVRLGHYLAQPYYDGKLDDIRIYERALSAGEINDLATGCGNTSSSASSQSSVASSASSQPCADVSTDDLTGYWKFDEGSGSTIIDSTSYNNQGVLQNGALRNVAAAPTSFGNPSALELDGVDDHALIGDPTGLPNGSTERTVALWVNRAAPTTQGTLVALGNTDDGTQKFIVQLAVVSGDTYLFTDGINGANNITLSGSQIPGAGWHHIAFTKDASDQWQYFLDGVLSKSGSFAVPINTNTNDVEIGSRHDNGNDGFFQGLLDDTRLYNRVLTGTEIQNLADGCGNVSSSASSVSSTASSQSSVDSSVSSSASSQISSVNSSVSSVASSVASSSQASSNNSSSVANIPQCNGQTATVYVKNGLIVGGPQNGQPFNGILNGTNGDDVIVGTAGSDEIHGRNGDDLICARAGSDKVEGDNGKDTIHGGPGSDLLTGNNGQDTVFGGADSDELLGNDGVDVLCGRGQEDFLRGGNGNDRMDGGGSFDYLQGNNGQDACANGESLQSCEQTPSSIPECSAADVN